MSFGDVGVSMCSCERDSLAGIAGQTERRGHQVLGSEEAFNSHLRNNAEGGCCGT